VSDWSNFGFYSKASVMGLCVSWRGIWDMDMGKRDLELGMGRTGGCPLRYGSFYGYLPRYGHLRPLSKLAR